MTTGDHNTLRILIADDEPDILAIMAKKIKDAGYAVLTAGDGQEAWDLIGRENPDIILLDLIMPKMDGYAVLRKLREDNASPKWRPVIIISAQGELDDIQKGFALEADHYITKPCRMEDVLKGIQLMARLIPQRKTEGE